MPRILVSITAHGLGHLGQIAPLLRNLIRVRRDVVLTVRTAISADIVRQQIGQQAEVEYAADDFGVCVRNGFEIDAGETYNAYTALQAKWPEVFNAARTAIAAQKPDLLLANIGHVAIAAGNSLSIPVYGISSLDWYSVLSGYENMVEAPFLETIATSYAGAAGFLELEPSFAMGPWASRTLIGAVAALGRDRRAALNEILALSSEQRLVVCAFGGGVPASPPTDWRRCPSTTFLAPASWAGAENVIPLDRVPMSFIDILASSDACITKLGYGIAMEATRNRVALLYHRREGWAEDIGLAGWIHANGRAVRIDLPTLDAATLDQTLAALSARITPANFAFEAEERFLAFVEKALAH